MSLRFLLTLSGGLEAIVGVLVLISPTTVVTMLLGGPMDSIASVLSGAVLREDVKMWRRLGNDSR